MNDKLWAMVQERLKKHGFIKGNLLGLLPSPPSAPFLGMPLAIPWLIAIIIGAFAGGTIVSRLLGGGGTPSGSPPPTTVNVLPRRNPMMIPRRTKDPWQLLGYVFTALPYFIIAWGLNQLPRWIPATQKYKKYIRWGALGSVALGAYHIFSNWFGLSFSSTGPGETQQAAQKVRQIDVQAAVPAKSKGIYKDLDEVIKDLQSGEGFIEVWILLNDFTPAWYYFGLNDDTKFSYTAHMQLPKTLPASLIRGKGIRAISRSVQGAPAITLSLFPAVTFRGGTIHWIRDWKAVVSSTEYETMDEFLEDYSGFDVYMGNVVVPAKVHIAHWGDELKRQAILNTVDALRVAERNMAGPSFAEW